MSGFGWRYEVFCLVVLGDSSGIWKLLFVFLEGSYPVLKGVCSIGIEKCTLDISIA